jgi:lysophospholipase L1-like esterase
MRIFQSLMAGVLVLVSSSLLRAQATQPSINPNLPTIWIAGDSTAASGERGWGSHLGSFFDLTKVNVVNKAVGGRSARTFMTEGTWQTILDQLKPADIVLIQLSHNDGAAIGSPLWRGSIPGLGDETQEVPKRDGTPEVVHTFGWYIRKYVADVRAKGATPIMMNLTVRNIWTNPNATLRDSTIIEKKENYNPADDKVERGSGQYSKWNAELAKELKVTFVDVTNIIADEYEKMGREQAAKLFGDHTHTNPTGGELNAKLIVSGLKGLKGHPLDQYLSDKGKAVAANDKYAEK